jgi:CRP/FNR family transcriptional regulator
MTYVTRRESAGPTSIDWRQLNKRPAAVRNRSAAEKAAALARSHLFSAAPAAALDGLAVAAEFRVLDRGEMLFMAGEPARGLFVVVSGSIRAFRVNAKGREQTIHVESAGATLAEVPVFDDGNYPATAVAEEPSEVLFLSKADVNRFLIANPEVALAALRLMAGRLRRHAELVDSLALKDVGQRLARLLLSEARAQGSRQVDFSNQQLAARVGSVREVISRTLGRLAQSGMIDIDARARGITLLDEDALERFAESEV